MTQSQLARLNQRYNSLVLEGYYAMMASTDFKELQSKWLRFLERSALFPSMEDWINTETQLRENGLSTWRALQHEVSQLSEAYGIAHWQVLWSMFVENFHPRPRDSYQAINLSNPQHAGALFPVDCWFPSARLLVFSAPPDTLSTLVQLSSSSSILVERAFPEEGHSQLQGVDAFGLLLEFSVQCSPELAELVLRRSISEAREMLRAAGINVPHRIRTEDVKSIKYEIATHSEGADFIERLRVICGARDISLVVRDERPSNAPADESGKSNLALVRLQLEIPLNAKVQDMVKELKNIIRQTREVLAEAGLDLGVRLRPARVVEEASRLKVDGTRIENRGLGDLVDDLYGVTPWNEGKPDPEGQRKRNLLKSKRNQISDRLKRKGFLQE